MHGEHAIVYAPSTGVWMGGIYSEAFSLFSWIVAVSDDDDDDVLTWIFVFGLPSFDTLAPRL